MNNNTSYNVQMSINDFPDNVVIYRYIDDDFILVDINKHAQVAEKVSKEALIGKKLTELFSTFKESRFSNLLRSVQTNGTEQELKITLHDGNNFSSKRHYSIRKLINGDLIVFYKDLKDEEAQLKLHNSFLKILVNTIPNPIFYKNKKGIYQNCNDAFSKTILGIPQEDIVGKSLYEFPDMISKELADIYHKKDQELINNPGSQSYASQVKCADGITRYYNFYKATFMSDSQEVLGVVGIMLDMSDYQKTLKELDEKNTILNELSITDALTRVYNRRYFEEMFTKKLNLLKRHQQPFAFMIIDIDYFKNYNDTFGHHLGDKTLQQVAKTIVESFSRPNDYVFRLGGEEFGVIFHFNDVRKVLELVQQVIQNVEDLKITSGCTTASPYVTISAGLSIIQSIRDGEITGEKIYIKVDKLLYHSKENGRNQFTHKVLFNDKMPNINNYNI